jgi:hypothetical protein
MGLCEYILFEKKKDLQINEKTYFFGLCYIIQNQFYFSKQKPNDVCTNVFDIHIGPLWGTNIDAQYF